MGWGTCTFVNGCHEGDGWATFDPTLWDPDDEECRAGVHRDSRDGVSVHAAPNTPTLFAEMLAKGSGVVVSKMFATNLSSALFLSLPLDIV